MDNERTTRDSWKTLPMPEAKIQLHVDRTFTEEEYHTWPDFHTIGVQLDSLSPGSVSRPERPTERG